MNTRDELADLIAFETADAPSGDLVRCSADGETPVFKLDERLASAILAAGYRKPHTITTAEELDALPEGTQIVDQCERLTLEETSIQYLEWVDRHGNACHVELPATILEAKP